MGWGLWLIKEARRLNKRKKINNVVEISHVSSLKQLVDNGYRSRKILDSDSICEIV